MNQPDPALQRLRNELDEVLADLVLHSQEVFLHAAKFFALNNKMTRTGEGSSYKLNLYRDWAIRELDEQLGRIRKFKAQIKQVEQTVKAPFPMDRLKRQLAELLDLQKDAVEVVEELKLL